jgi:hypothetical protein
MSETQQFNYGEEIPVMQEFAESDIDEIRHVLHKYEGDFNADEIEAGLAGEPIETLVFVNGELVEHIINGAEGGT